MFASTRVESLGYEYLIFCMYNACLNRQLTKKCSQAGPDKGLRYRLL